MEWPRTVGGLSLGSNESVVSNPGLENHVSTLTHQECGIGGTHPDTPPSESLSCIQLHFCRRRKGLCSVNIPYAKQFLYDILLLSIATFEDKVRKAKELTKGHSYATLTPISYSSYYIMLTTHVGRGYTYAKWKYPHSSSACDFSLPSLFALWGQWGRRKGEIFVLVHYHWSSSPEYTL